VYETKNTNQKQVQDLPAWGEEGPAYQKSRVQQSPGLIHCNGQRSSEHQGGLKGPPGLRFGDFIKHKLDKTVVGGEGKKYSTRQCKVYAVHKM
jgi:hypothetical protein